MTNTNGASGTRATAKPARKAMTYALIAAAALVGATPALHAVSHNATTHTTVVAGGKKILPNGQPGCC